MIPLIWVKDFGQWFRGASRTREGSGQVVQLQPLLLFLIPETLTLLYTMPMALGSCCWALLLSPSGFKGRKFWTVSSRFSRRICTCGSCKIKMPLRTVLVHAYLNWFMLPSWGGGSSLSHARDLNMAVCVRVGGFFSRLNWPPKIASHRPIPHGPAREGNFVHSCALGTREQTNAPLKTGRRE